MSVLEDSPESANLARRMRNELSTLNTPDPERLKRKGWRYTVSAEYKEDFIDLQDNFGKMFHCSCEALRSHVSVTVLKEYLCQNFPELVVPLKDAITIDDVMEAVRNNSSLTDIAYFKVIANKFSLRKMRQNVAKYRKMLNSFCQHTLHNHSYVRSFREDYPRYILSSDKIVFQLQWNTTENTMKDIRDVLQMSFGQLADRVQIVVIEVGSVVVVCYAPQYLMEKLLKRASRNVHKLIEIGVVKLTVGGTEVITDKVQIITCTSYYDGMRQRQFVEYNDLSSDDDDSQMEKNPNDIIRLYSAELVQATVDPVQLANTLYREGIIDHHTTSQLLISNNKAVKLWTQIENHIQFHKNPRQALLNVCNIMKQHAELESLANMMVSELMPNADTRVHFDNIWFWMANLCFLVSFILEITLNLVFIKVSDMILILTVLLYSWPLFCTIILLLHCSVQTTESRIDILVGLLNFGSRFSRYMHMAVEIFYRVITYAYLFYFRKLSHQLQQDLLLYSSTVMPYYFIFCSLASFVLLVYKPLGDILIALLYGLYAMVTVVHYSKIFSFSKYFDSGSFLFTLRKAIGIAFIINWDTIIARNLIIILFYGLFGVLLIINQKVIDMTVVWKCVTLSSMVNIIIIII